VGILFFFNLLIFDISITGSSNNKNLFSGNIFFSINNFLVSLVGQNTLLIFLEINIQRVLLKKFNFG
tara:strand:+ start:364 stop:564 length:201 start_codon:yes stop_codon:yes gene_type:complete